MISSLSKEFHLISQSSTDITVSGINKFNELITKKSLSKIISESIKHNEYLEAKRNTLNNIIIKLQSEYCSKYKCDLGIGTEEITRYVEENHKLKETHIIKYEENLNKAKENCELEFRESFLAKLKENIENARLEFKYLNSALKDIFYGEDSYKFDITHNKKTERIYQMITSKNNIGGYNLWSSTFEQEYKEEMDDLFSKLIAYDDKGEKLLSEYTDYRNYLDYDIIIEKKDGSIQRFSKIYGDNSGGETQTPYYVAIAASFLQLYSKGDTIRIIMLDEAFDKMDDDRISAMMDFFNSQHFQIILATPPAKIEVIGEKVDTILIAMRENNISSVWEYDLN